MKKIITQGIAALLLVAGTMTAQAQKYVGGDISMLKTFVDAGAVYNDKDGNAVEPLAFFKEQGWNAMRVRLFVNPENASAAHKKEGVVQDLEYVKALGKQIKDAGFSFMLDFHYSDTWTDPGKHSTPSAWTSLSVEQLKAKVYEYTKDCLTQLKAAGATPDFIQTGNEITTGMLWNTGKVNADGTDTSNGSMANLAGYLASAIKACNEECPQAQIVIHTELHAPSSLPSFYQKLSQYTDVKYDIIGLSYYPDYHGALSVLENIVNTFATSYPTKKVMIVETGYGFEWQLNDATKDLTATWSISEEGQRQFAADLITMLNKHDNVNGLFWWYPEYTLNNIVFKNGSEDWNSFLHTGYWNAALFHYKTGKAHAALYELKAFAPTSGMEAVKSLPTEADQRYYTLDGRRVSGVPTARGIYINNGRKIVVK